MAWYWWQNSLHSLPYLAKPFIPLASTLFRTFSGSRCVIISTTLAHCSQSANDLCTYRCPPSPSTSPLLFGHMDSSMLATHILPVPPSVSSLAISLSA